MEELTTNLLDSQAGASSRTEIEYEDVFVPMTKHEKTTWISLAGTNPRCMGNKKHFHPILAASRFVLEKQACELLLESQAEVIIDVGAAPKRTFPMLGNKGRFLMPELQLGDRQRFNECPPEALDRVCYHTLEQCVCHFPGGRARKPTALLFVHSAYYIQPMDMWKLLVDDNVKSVMVVGHDFTEPFGGFLNECTWQMEGDRVHMRVTGNSHDYVHPLLPWLSGWRGPDGEAIRARTIRTIGKFTYLWELEAFRSAPDIINRFESMSVENPFLGPVQFSVDQRGIVQSDAKIKNVGIDLDRVYRAGSALYVTDQSERVVVTIPMSLITIAEIKASGRARTPELWNDVSNAVKRAAPAARVPQDKIGETIIFATALGYVKSLSKEIDVLYTMHSRFGVLYGPMDALVKFTIPRVWSCLRVFLCLVIPLLASAAVAALTLHFVRAPHEKSWDLLILVFAVTTVVGLYYGLRCCHSAIQSVEHERVQTWTSEYSQFRTMSLPTPVLVPKPLRGLPGSRNAAPPAPIDPGASFTVQPEPTRDSNNRQIDRSFLVGLSPDTVGVNVLEPCQEVDVSMVTNRLLIPVDLPDQEVLDRAGDKMDEIFSRLKPSIDFSENGFNRWVQSQRSKFPAPVIAKWVELRSSLDPNEWFPRNTARPFVKLEKSSKFVTRDGQKPVKPRGIAPPSDAHKVVLGPPISSLYARARNFFSPGGNKVVYASGCTTDALGKAVDEYMGRHPEAFGIWIDGSNYDATLQFLQQVRYLENLENCGFTPQMISLLLETEMKGRTTSDVTFKASTFLPASNRIAECLKRWGIEYKVHYHTEKDKTYFEINRIQMWSGRMDTNLADTLILMSVVEAWLDSVSISDYLLLLCGDDMFLLNNHFDQGLFDSLCKFYSNFGFKPSGGFSQSRHMWEFCSKLFWYGRVGQEVQTVLGPKPGRCIARFGYSVALPKEQNIAASAIGLMNDANHVPLVGELAKRTHELCKAHKIKPKYGSREHELHASRRFEVAEENYAILEDRYNLNRESVSHYAAILSAVESIPSFYHWDEAERVAMVDE